MPKLRALCPCGAPSEGWPGDDGTELCQMCWESQCDAAWWAMLAVFEVVEEDAR